jgi:hypothetical protein
MALVELARYTNSFDAGAAASFLNSEGIETFLFDVEMAWVGMGLLVPVRLMVVDDELERARRLLGASGG